MFCIIIQREFFKPRNNSIANESNNSSCDCKKIVSAFFSHLKGKDILLSNFFVLYLFRNPVSFIFLISFIIDVHQRWNCVFVYLFIQIDISIYILRSVTCEVKKDTPFQCTFLSYHILCMFFRCGLYERVLV